jgi:hypothetical protein
MCTFRVPHLSGPGGSTLGRPRSLAWAGYAAAAWAIAYAVAVRGYHAAGGTVGLPGRLEDPAHALTGYVTKSRHLLGVMRLEFRGWARLDEGELILWDLLFYEPWFLGLGVLVTLGAVHHHRRTGGSARGARRLALATAAGTLALTALFCLQLAADGG